MTPIVAHFIPTLAQVGGLAALLLVCCAMISLGRLVAGGRRLAEADLVCGWALTTAAFVILGTLTTLSLAVIAIALAIPAIVGIAVALRGKPRSSATDLARILVLGLPLVALVTAMIPSQWDEFTQWLPNARYLFEENAFPRSGLTEPFSAKPAYPYGMPLVTYLTSRIVGALTENAGALFNVMLLLSFALLIGRVIRDGVHGIEPAQATSVAAPLGWFYCALGGLAVTILNPTFVPKLVFSAYADASTAVVVGFAGVLGWMVLNVIAEGRRSAARRRALQLGFVFTILISVKQANLAIMVAILAALSLVAWREQSIGIRHFIRLTPLMLALPAITYASWQFHVGEHLQGGAASILPRSSWLISQIPDIIARMLLVASKKGGYFGVMVVAIVCGVIALRKPGGTFGRLAIIASFTFLIYNACLFVLYVISFGPYEGPRAASYWRYNTQLGGLAVVFAAYGLALLWHRQLTTRVEPRFRWIAIVLILVLPVAMGKKLRFDVHPPKLYVRHVGEEMATMLPAGARIVSIDPKDNGFYSILLRYALYRSATLAGWVSAFSDRDTSSIRSSLATRKASHVWVHESTPEVDAALGVRLPLGSSYLLARDGDRWSIQHAWPYPGYRLPSELPH